MANYNTIQTEKMLARPVEFLDVTEAHGRVRAFFGKIASIGVRAAGTTFFIARIPSGARILPQSFMMTSTAQSTATFAIGSAPTQPSGDLGGTITANKYGTARTQNVANGKLELDVVSALANPLTVGEDIYITTAVANTVDGVLFTGIYYVVD